MKNNIIVWLLVCLLSSCRPDNIIAAWGTVFVNQTPYHIEVKAYNGGTVSYHQYAKFEIKPYDSTKTGFDLRGYQTRERGSSYASFIYQDDSVVIWFDKTAKSVHLSAEETHFARNTKAILFYSPRNLFFSKNYTHRVVSESRKGVDNEYRYVFTEQDYLDAQK